MNEFHSPYQSPPIPPPAPAIPAAAPPLAAATTADDVLKSAAEKTWNDLKPQLESLWEQSKKYAEQNPGKALLGAVGAGFVLGFLFRN